MEWESLLLVILAGMFIWLIYRNVKRSPDSFSKANISKSFLMMGTLAIVLIGFITFCILLLQSM